MRTTPGECVLGSDVASMIFGVDGVVVDSAQASAAAWKSVLDPFLRTYAAVHETTFVPFDVCTDYLRHVHGKPRLEAARDFLASRDITLPFDALRGLVARQEEFFLGEVRRHGLIPFPSTIVLVRQLRRYGVRTAAVSTQRYGAEMLRRAGVTVMFDLVLDGLDAPGTRLPTKPDCGVFLQAALRLGIPPGRTAVVEETTAGVTAAQLGGFKLVVGVDRIGGVGTLREHGADAVITDLSQLRLPGRRAA
jgi:beta-phosphoglucomutase-like phosphatase (HAD superfamily)